MELIEADVEEYDNVVEKWIKRGVIEDYDSVYLISTNVKESRDKFAKENPEIHKEYIKTGKIKKDNEESEEEIVKDKDGVQWVKRKKIRGEGTTYCRKDDRSVTMSQKEYNKRRRNTNENKLVSLKNFLIEQLNY